LNIVSENNITGHFIDKRMTIFIRLN